MHQQVTYVPAYTNHLLHLTLSIVTLGLWVPVWFTVWIVNHNRTVPRTDWVSTPQYVYQAPIHVYGQGPTTYPGYAWCTTHQMYEAHAWAR